MNSNDQDNVRKKEIKKVNFIQKNKVLVTNKNKSNTDILIRCLNDDIDDSVKVVTTINDNDHLNNSNQIEFEISIISNHSSTISSDHNLKDNKQLVQGNEYKPESDLIFSSEYLKLINEKNEYQQDSKENEVNIIKFDQDNKSKIRSQFMQRFGSLNHKRQITPNMIEQNDNTNKRTSVEYTPLSTITTTAVEDSSPSTLEIKNQLTRFCNSYKMNDQDPLTTASIAASIAAMSVVNSQPFTKIQNDFDEKITNVLKELENMRKSDEKLFKKKKIIENSESSDEEKVSTRRNQEKESEFRIKHLEKLQEKQFDMMSQLINVIGTENSKADQTAHNGKENVKTFKKQIKKIIEPNYNDDKEEQDDDDYEDYIKFTQNLNKNNKNKIQTVRSRSQNKENVVKKRTNTDSKKKIESSRSRSGSRSCCRMRNTQFSGAQFKNSCENLDLYERKNKKTEFLEELLDSDLPKIKPTTLTINNNLNDTQQPLLFDKYLVNKF